MNLKSAGIAVGTAVALTATGAVHAISAIGKINDSEAKFSFQDYQERDLQPKVGNGLVDENTLFFFKEKEVNGVQSWYVFFDPSCKATVDAEITFDSAISGIVTSSRGLADSNSIYGLGGVYESVKYTGLEYHDKKGTSWSGNTLRIHWNASDPGDHMRVMTTAIPEPQTYLLMAMGLGALAFVARRRKLALK